jgi:multiple sugar transport system permease protein
MSRSKQVPAAEGFRGRLQGSDVSWMIAFLIPYGAVFLAFAAYPIAYGIWMGRDPALYRELFSDPHYLRAVANTFLYVGVGVNVMMFLALLLSGFFMRRRRWIKALLIIYILPWALPAVPAYLSFHWMLIGEQGLLNSLLQVLFGVDGPIWFNHRGLALGSNIIAYVWKWMPFWTVIFIAGRMAIRTSMRRPTWMVPLARVALSMSPFHSWRTSISCARCFLPSGCSVIIAA